MSITHDNSGTRRTQAQRDAARLIEAGEFIAADTPAGRAIIDALPEAARRAEEARGRGGLRFLEPIIVDAPLSVETSVFGIDRVAIRADRDEMRAELRSAMERASTTLFLESEKHEATFLCLAIVSGDTIGIQVNMVCENILPLVHRCAIFAYDKAAEALKRHNGMSVKFESSFSRTIHERVVP